MTRTCFILLLALLLPACAGTSRLAEEIAAEGLNKRGMSLQDAPAIRLQMIVTEVRDGRRKDHTFRADAEYFYPASTVKVLGAITAVHAFEHINAPLDSTLEWTDVTEGGRALFVADKGEIRLDREIRRMLIISDNESFNLCYDIVGQKEMNDLAHEWGLKSVRINHRLSRSVRPEMRTVTGGVTIRMNERDVVMIPERHGMTSNPCPPIPGLKVGEGVLRNGSMTNEPMDFTNHNRISLHDLHEMTIALTHPALSDIRIPIRDFDTVVAAMGTLPRESRDPEFDAKKYTDDWGKFLLPGVGRVIDPNRIQIENKVGLAYGFLIDSARIIDMNAHREFFMTVAMYVNSDGVLNDDRYDYETIGLPLMADLGEAAAKRLLRP
jgi:hypothetical protein